jgi:hypothetical protein
MTSVAEDVLYLSLTDTDSIEALAQIGLDEAAIPTEEMRPVVAWAIDRFFESGRTRAPSRAALLDTWGQHIEDAGVELLPEDEDADTIQWAIDTLKAQYVHFEYVRFVKESSVEMSSAPTPDKVDMLARQADVLFDLSMRVQPRHMQADAREGFAHSLAAYEARALEGHVTRGMTFGLPQVDEHTYGIHEGELAVLAAGPKTGKSFFLDRAAKECWQAGKATTLFTLENSVSMTMDRIVCMHLGINSRNYQRGLCTPEQVDHIRWFLNDEMPKMDAPLNVIMPEPGKRSMAAMVRQAQMMGTQRLFIDQLTFVEHTEPGRKARHEIIRDLMHDLKTLISSGNQPIPCLLAHQVNREGVNAARKVGYLLMEHMAEGSEVERTADWVFGLWQSGDDRIAGEALLQVLAARREDNNAWKLVWQPSSGLVAVSHEEEIDL